MSERHDLGDPGPPSHGQPSLTALTSDFIRQSVMVGMETTNQLVGLPLRMLRLLEQLELVLGGVREVADNVNGLADRANYLLDRAEAVVDDAQGATSTMTPLVDVLRPTVQQLTAELDDDEVRAALEHLIDQLPDLIALTAEHSVPVMNTLQNLGPNIAELVGVTKDVRRALIGVPGMKRLRNRAGARRTTGRPPGAGAAIDPPPTRTE
ncbi:hypothetical protein [Williamsia sterculiae]|uniref:Uncharacterized protein n=1 Tax=Williamsia sterculiae TaxID=1344003 RepID=A0A1N7FSC1_9NOCA|nr:hypothetical protein [Williamsia sterculiae]SIS03220.1 hypothetical protein SAMN05445060_2243 [Williamsia sterculiae]